MTLILQNYVKKFYMTNFFRFFETFFTRGSRLFTRQFDESTEKTIVPIPVIIFKIIITLEIILLKCLSLFTKILWTTKGIRPPIPAIIPTIKPAEVCLWISSKPQNKSKITGMCRRRNPVIFPGSFNISHSFSYADSISCNNSKVAFRM